MHVTPDPASLEQLIEQIPRQRPLWFRYQLPKFRGDLPTLHAQVQRVLERQTSPKVRAHVGLVLLCLGHPAGGKVLLETLNAADEAARRHVVGELDGIWSYERGHGNPPQPLPISLSELGHALAIRFYKLESGIDTEEARKGLEFCLQHACEETLADTRPLLRHADVNVRSLVALGYLAAGFNEGALAEAVAHWQGPLPAAAVPLDNWRKRALQYARALLRYTADNATPRMQALLTERVIPLLTTVVRKTLTAHDVHVRTWFNVDHRTGDGYFNHLLELVARAGSEESNTLLQQVVQHPRVAAYSRANAAYLFAQASGRAPDGAEKAVAGMVCDTGVYEGGRGRMLGKCVVTLAADARLACTYALLDVELRNGAAECIRRLPPEAWDEEVRASLRDVLKGETRGHVRQRLANTLVAIGAGDEAAIAALNPWESMVVRWQQRGITLRQVADTLIAAGAIDPIPDEELAVIQNRTMTGQDILLNLGFRGARGEERMAYGSLRDSGFDPRHDELFQHLVRITRPLPAVEAVSQTRHEVRTEQDAATAGLMSFRDGEMKPVPPQQIAGLKLGSFEGTTCTVRYRYRGQEREFSARPDGSWMDAQGVLRAFNAFMQEIGREERAFRLADAPGTDGEHAFFLCAKQQPFLAAAAELGIPLALPSEQLQSDLPAGSP